MKKFFVIALTFGLTLVIWSGQRARRQFLLLENERAATTLAELDARIATPTAARQIAEQRSTELRNRLELRKTEAPEKSSVESRPVYQAAAAPDPAHQGGWPAGVDYFYLPKQFLTNANFKLVNGQQLTDEAAALLGMTPGERANVNQSISTMLNQFRELELKNIKPVPVPESWQSFSLSSFGAVKSEKPVVYEIPALGDDVAALRQNFSQQLEQTLGPARAQLIDQSADTQLRQQLDDLGASKRVVGFFQGTESDGSYTVWYGMSDAAHGDGSFQRVPNDLDPNSQMAYYANLFGVKLPEK